MTNIRTERCPTCGVEMDYIKGMMRESLSELTPHPRLGIPSGSAIWRCPEHGQFRIYISGAVLPFA